MKFQSVLRNIILEASRYAVLRDNLTKPTKDKKGNRQKPKLSVEEYIQLAQADPTLDFRNIDPNTEDPNELDRIRGGNYLNWIIKNYLTPTTERSPEDAGYDREVAQAKSVFLEDIYKITEDLKKFDKFKNRFPVEQRDIMKLTPSQVYDLVKDLSLEKTKATKAEKEEAASSYEYPGGEVIFRGNNWTVVKITDQGKLGKDAACFYGGYHLEPSKGETRWCTSSPGLNWFERYIKDGPLYVVIPNNWTGKLGEKSRLPATRYQFHFPSNQFMDPSDHQIDLIEMLNGPMKEMKNMFKPEFAKGLTIGGGTKFEIDDLRHGSVGKYISLYGIEDLLDSLPDNLETFSVSNKGNQNITIQLPKDMGRFKDLSYIYLSNCVSEIPESICNLKKLRFLTLLDNSNLRSIPSCLANSAASQGGNLLFINLKGSDNVEIPEEIKKVSVFFGKGIWDLQGG